MARTRDRVFALVVAVVFFVTTVGLSGLIIWQMIEENRVNDTATEQKKMDDFTPVTKVEELKKIDLKEGDGQEAKPGDTVTVDYTGAVAATGVIFQSSKDFGQPISFGLNEVIAGWKDGIPGMKIGGKRRLIIPAEQAYGANPPQGSGIPVNAALVFDVELHSIGEVTAQDQAPQENAQQ